MTKYAFLKYLLNLLSFNQLQIEYLHHIHDLISYQIL